MGRRAERSRQGNTDAAPLVAIVDDDDSVRESTFRLIRSLGYRAAAFATGEEFLASHAVSEAACLVLDVRMPGMDGLEVQRRLAAMRGRLPIVFVTGRGSDDEERRARAGGASAFLHKPVAREAFLEILKKATGQE